ncbi:MAG: cytochrome c oxidase accessory protein CcoG [Gammaproteobacteria bacterium]|nr:cytochrome c oxidase accessory protein CcoG [Gammaproteobacteria bacterium]
MNRLIPVTQVSPNSSPSRAPGKIYPRSFSGIYRQIRMGGGAILFALYFGTVWLNWGERQAVLWDIADKKFHIFSATYWPEDLVLLSAILIICAFGLFFITAVAGRIWCGYACPQSVWMWVFLWAEKLAEGDRRQRMKLDSARMSQKKILRRLLKHGLWLLISAVTAVTFVGYFTPIRDLVPDLLSFNLSGSALFWVFFFTAATYVNAGWFREKVCLHMCPYGRFQSSMVDNESLVVAYDAGRGDPRGSRSIGSDPSAQGLGDCIDCEMCVQVCPTGIDIRDGLQMECIGCAACIDACDSIMDKMGYEKGLIRYASFNELNTGTRHILRPRLVAYFFILATMIGLFSWALITRPLITLEVERDRGLFRYNGSGLVENSYLLNLTNKSNETRHTFIRVYGAEGFSMRGPDRVTLNAAELREIPVVLEKDASSIPGAVTDVSFEVTTFEEPDRRIVARTTFLAPAPIER